MIFNIQSIGLNIYTFSLLFIFINNILLSTIRFIIQNLDLNNLLKEKLINIWLLYTKIIYSYPIYVLRQIFSISGKILKGRPSFLILNRYSNFSFFC